MCKRLHKKCLKWKKVYLFLGVPYALVYLSEEQIWTRSCLPVCGVHRIVITVTLVYIVTMTLNHIISTITSDNIVALDNIVAFVITLVALLTSSPVMCLKNHLWNFSVLHRVHLFSLVYNTRLHVVELKSKSPLERGTWSVTLRPKRTSIEKGSETLVWSWGLDFGLNVFNYLY
jgi:hypothetical protein